MRAFRELGPHRVLQFHLHHPIVCVQWMYKGRTAGVSLQLQRERPVMPVRAENQESAERAQRDTRLSIRTSSQQQHLIRRAATALDKSVTDFVLDSAASAAERVLADRRWFLLSEEEWDQFQALMDEPVAAMPRLERTLTTPTVFDQKDA